MRRPRSLLLLLAGLLCACGDPRAETFLVGAAASTTNALTAATDAWNARSTGSRAARVSFGASSSVARQLEGGAPFEVVVSADARWIDRLREGGHVDPTSVVSVGQNGLVVAGRRELIEAFGGTEQLGPGVELPEALAALKWTTGHPDHVPVGGYAREALGALGWWSRLEPGLVAARDVRAGLRLVESGEADLCIAYTSDVADRTLAWIPFDDGLHGEIRVVAAASVDAGADARDFLEFLTSPAARSLPAPLGEGPAAAEEATR